jgi:hypothetical protein
VKQYECVQVGHHKDLGPVTDEYQKDGWHLHTYQATMAASIATPVVNHYLLFEKEAT